MKTEKLFVAKELTQDEIAQVKAGWGKVLTARNELEKYSTEAFHEAAVKYSGDPKWAEHEHVETVYMYVRKMARIELVENGNMMPKTFNRLMLACRNTCMLGLSWDVGAVIPGIKQAQRVYVRAKELSGDDWPTKCKEALRQISQEDFAGIAQARVNRDPTLVTIRLPSNRLKPTNFTWHLVAQLKSMFENPDVIKVMNADDQLKDLRATVDEIMAKLEAHGAEIMERLAKVA